MTSVYHTGTVIRQFTFLLLMHMLPDKPTVAEQKG